MVCGEAWANSDLVTANSVFRGEGKERVCLCLYECCDQILLMRKFEIVVKWSSLSSIALRVIATSAHMTQPSLNVCGTCC